MRIENPNMEIVPLPESGSRDDPAVPDSTSR
jgi:hypothetical protein